eukprot:scaffold2727_cov275-Chaetoceros_neogracile.AAC.41
MSWFLIYDKTLSRWAVAIRNHHFTISNARNIWVTSDNCKESSQSSIASPLQQEETYLGDAVATSLLLHFGK